MNSSNFYRHIPDPPDKVSGTTIFIRMLDGLGFRFYWATEDLRSEDYAFQPGPDTFRIGELVQHIWGLVRVPDAMPVIIVYG